MIFFQTKHFNHLCHSITKEDPTSIFHSVDQSAPNQKQICRLQYLEILLQAHQMMKTEVSSVWGPQKTFSSFWACQTSQPPYSQWQWIPSLFLSPNINLPLSSLWIMDSLSETKPQTGVTQQKSQTSFCWISFLVCDVPVSWLQPQEAVMASCLMKWQNNRLHMQKQVL